MTPKVRAKTLPTQANERVWDYRCTFMTLRPNMNCARCGHTHSQTQAEAIAKLRETDREREG